MKLLRAFVGFLLAGLSVGCPSKPQPVVYDLARRTAVADLASGREVLLFGTPSAEPRQIEGFFRDAAQAGGSAYVWARGESEVVWDWPQPASRAVVVDMAPYVGVRGQEVEVRLNGTAVGSARLADIRQRYLFPLPASAQKAGENRLRLVFSRTASPADAVPKNEDKRQLAAQLYSLTFGAGDDPGLLALLARDAPRPFSVADQAGVPVLTQLATSSVRYAVRLGKGSELSFTPDLHPAARAAGASAAFRVTIEDKPGAERELWSRVVTAKDRDPEEVTLDVSPSSADGIVRIGLHVAGAPDDTRAWGVWRAPRILGRERFDPLARPVVPADARKKADRLVADLGPVNVLLVVLDAARAMQFGCYGYPRPTTPEIDRIAAEGVVFERAYTPAVYTLAAMSSVWTSQYPDLHHNAVSYDDRLPTGPLTLAELLTAQGLLSTAFVANAMAGAGKGFDRGFGEFHDTFRDVGSRGDAFREVLPDWFGRHRNRRFFAYVHFREPHFPYDPEPPFDTRFGPDGPIPKAARRDQEFFRDVNQGDRPFTSEEAAHLVRLYDGNLAYADQEVGQIRKSLEAAGLWERTVVIVMADHGEGLFEHGWIGHNVDLHEPSIHIPLIVRFPSAKAPRSVRIRGFVDLLDVAPTVADLMGVLDKGRAAEHFQGQSLLPTLFGGPGKAAILSRTLWNQPRYALRDDRFKLIYETRTGASQLYDLKADPSERRDVVAEQPFQAAYLKEALQDAITGMVQAAGPAVPGKRVLPSRADCENMKSLGYVSSDTQCPES